MLPLFLKSPCFQIGTRYVTIWWGWSRFGRWYIWRLYTQENTSKQNKTDAGVARFSVNFKKLLFFRWEPHFKLQLLWFSNQTEYFEYAYLKHKCLIFPRDDIAYCIFAFSSCFTWQSQQKSFSKFPFCRKKQKNKVRVHWHRTRPCKPPQCSTCQIWINLTRLENIGDILYRFENMDS